MEEHHERATTATPPSPSLLPSLPSASAVHLFRLEKVKIGVLQHLKRSHCLSHEELWKRIQEGARIPLPATTEKKEKEEDPETSSPTTTLSSSFCILPPLSFHVSVGMFKVVVEELIEKQLLRRHEGVMPSTYSSSLPYPANEKPSEENAGVDSEKENDEAKVNSLAYGVGRRKRSSASGGVYYECMV